MTDQYAVQVITELRNIAMAIKILNQTLTETNQRLAQLPPPPPPRT